MASQEIEALSGALARLPGLGPRSARRAVLWLIKRRETALAQLVATKDAKWAEVIQHAQKAVSGSAQNFQQIGEASAAVLKAYPVGRS